MTFEERINKKRLLARFPEVDFACAYGSGAFSQNGYGKGERPMVDFILAVDSPNEWHRENMERNSRDYSAPAWALGTGTIDRIFPHAEMYYNPFVNFEGTQIKYGVISTENLRRDLREWSTLYCAGRLHKPVKTLQTTPDIEECRDQNLKSAASVALALLPVEFTEEEIYTKICGLSYRGDTRMGVAEDSHKVANIVEANRQGFRDLYLPILLEKSQEGVDQHTENYPDELRKRIAAADPSLSLEGQIISGISGIIRNSSRSQALKGIATAGMVNSGRYLAAKVMKAWK